MADPGEQRLLLERDGPILFVRFSRRPRPFFDERTGVEFERLVRQGLRDRTVRAIVFGDAFPSHADVGMLLRGARSTARPVCYPAARVVTALAGAVARVPVVDELLGRGPARDLVTLARIGRALTRLTRSDVVTIAAMDGLAIGMGTIVALACDIRLMADDARAGLPESALGMLAASGGTQRLVRAVGAGRALELLLDGRWLTAREAVEIGLVHRAVPTDRLMAEATTLAGRLGDRPALAVREIKRMVHDAGTRPIRRGLAIEAASLVATLTSVDAESRLATYGRWLEEHPDATDADLRRSWAPVLDGQPHTARHP